MLQRAKSACKSYLKGDFAECGVYRCRKYFYPRLVPGGVSLFDEYGFAPSRGEKDAVDEFFAGTLESGAGDGLKGPIAVEPAIK